MRIYYDEETFDKEKLMRCNQDRVLLTPEMVKRGYCAGHRLFIAEHLSLWEWLLWKMGWLR